MNFKLSVLAAAAALAGTILASAKAQLLPSRFVVYADSAKVRHASYN
jgi:hypothetical protein